MQAAGAYSYPEKDCSTTPAYEARWAFSIRIENYSATPDPGRGCVSYVLAKAGTRYQTPGSWAVPGVEAWRALKIPLKAAQL